MTVWKSSEQIADYFSKFEDGFNKENFKFALTNTIKSLVSQKPDAALTPVVADSNAEWPRRCEKCKTLHHFWWDWYDCCR